jgi:hypothetical protein
VVVDACRRKRGRKPRREEPEPPPASDFCEEQRHQAWHALFPADTQAPPLVIKPAHEEARPELNLGCTARVKDRRPHKQHLPKFDYSTPSVRLRAFWLDRDPRLIPRVQRARRLIAQDVDENYHFRFADEPYGRNDPVVLFDRVRIGVKPMATILLRVEGKHYMMEQTTVLTARAFGLQCRIFFTRTGRQEAVIFQGNTTLAEFYDPDETMAVYQQAGVSLPRGIFDVQLENFAYAVVTEEMPMAARYPVLGMCLGYPVHETLGLLQSLAVG